MAGSITIQGLLTGTTSGTQYVGPYTLVPNAAGNFAVTEVILVAGNNTIAVPTWATVCLIVPPTANVLTTMTLKGATGDTGTPLSLSAPSVISFPVTPPADLIITAAGSASPPTTFVFS